MTRRRHVSLSAGSGDTSGSGGAVMTHELKCWPEPFSAILSGLKTHEVRVNDRDYQLGDWLRLREWDPETGKYTGRTTEVEVSHITRGGEFGLPRDLVVMSITIAGEEEMPF